MQSQQDAAVIDIQSKLNELNVVQEFLTRANDFEPILTFDRESFGLVDLNQLCKSPFNSTIIESHLYIDKWKLIYRGSRDGFSLDDFQTRCVCKSPTLTIFKAKKSGYIFGEYTEVGRTKMDPNAYLFSLTNKDKKPLKIKIDLEPLFFLEPNQSVFCASEYFLKIGYVLDEPS